MGLILRSSYSCRDERAGEGRAQAERFATIGTLERQGRPREALGPDRGHHIHESAPGPLHEGCRDDRPYACLEASIAEGPQLGPADAELFHQSGRTRAQRLAAPGAGKGKEARVGASAAGQAGLVGLLRPEILARYNREGRVLDLRG
jgi:hypothetical protein